jgi:hypothetical protein
VSKVIKAAQNMDWQQVMLNGGPPCFYLEGERFCGRAQRWDGHYAPNKIHKFISLDALMIAVFYEDVHFKP